MYRFLITACTSLMLTTAAWGDATPSAKLSPNGLEATINVLEYLPTRSNDEHFTLGVANFLRGIESAFQHRYRTGMVDDTLDIPSLALPLPPNPNADPFTPDTIERIFGDVDSHMTKARAALDQISGDVALNLDLAELWLDIDANGTRNLGEGLGELGVLLALPAWESEAAIEQLADSPLAVVRLDTADVHWLSAYTHLMSGTANLALAFDPTTALTDVMTGDARLNDLRGGPAVAQFVTRDDANTLFIISSLIATLEQQPDVSRTRAAHAHLLEMMRDSETFWRLVEAETDNLNEWVPNDRQTAALPLEMPKGTGAAWQAVLKDTTSLLEGDLLVPHWLMNDTAGINLKSWTIDPEPIDIIGYIQGHALAKYMEQGSVADFQTLSDFNRVTGNAAGLFMLFLN
ncbi:hypothetical protein [Thalassobium sp. R2A62]|uniref:hypothetical protein n=1 Tax=Thalassobium sp. R2A62 TaxID=633131 RepID=UPI0001B1D0B5|nr:hypothetical protein [Thalassobium sp. R2A62]EET47131.1 hypothetical protein TR2A62_3139 [Thalassobium sp. R2A62]